MEYIVELGRRPLAFTVEAENKEEAIKRAREKFWEYTNGESVYSVESVEEKN